MPILQKEIQDRLEENKIERKVQPNDKEKTKTKFAMV
jgi:hypothetical protein